MYISRMFIYIYSCSVHPGPCPTEAPTELIEVNWTDLSHLREKATAE